MDEIKLCDYGCGQQAKHQFANGKWCCSKKFQQCPGHIENKRNKIKLKTIEYYKNETNDQKNKRIDAHKKYWTTKKKAAYSKKAKIFNKKNKRTIKKIKEKYPVFSNMEELRYTPDKLIKEREIQVHCKYYNCPNSKEKGGWFTPSGRQLEWRIEALEHGTGGRNFYCSAECKNNCPLYGFNPNYNFIKNKKEIILPYTQVEYNIFKEEVFERQRKEFKSNFCELCYSTINLQVHHEKPKKLYPIFSLDPDNGIVLCRECHLKKTHTGECSAIGISKTCKEKQHGYKSTTPI